MVRLVLEIAFLSGAALLNVGVVAIVLHRYRREPPKLYVPAEWFEDPDRPYDAKM